MNFLRKRIFLGITILLALAALGPGYASPAPRPGDPGTYTITISNFEFSPRNLQIPAGSKVIWVNKDDEVHKIADVNNLFLSKPLDTDDGFSFEFKAAGKYEYFCSLHPHMTGKIVVEAK
jgi:plastocyanin